MYSKLKTPEKEKQLRCESVLSQISIKSFNYNSFIDEIDECPDKAQPIKKQSYH